MPKIKLIQGRGRDFTTDKAQAFLWDAQVPGFAIRVAAGGSKAFIYPCKLNRRDSRASIGDVRAWAVADARGEARRRQEVSVSEAWAAHLGARKARSRTTATSWKPATIPSASNSARNRRKHPDQLERSGRCSLVTIGR